MKRSVTVKLQPSKEQEKTLFELAQATAIIWNKLNYQRLRQFKDFGKIDFNGTEKEAHHEFKNWIGGSTVQQLARKNAEAWRSFFTLNRKKKKGEIDLGVNNLMAVYVENGEGLLVNGRPLKSIDFYWRRKIAEYQSKLNRCGAKTSRKLKRMHDKSKLQARHYINTAIRQTVRRLYELGVSKIVVGYPKGITRNSSKGGRQNFLLSHVWRFNYVIKRLKEVAEEFGIVVMVVNEAFTSQTCPLCGQRHSDGRIFRGLFKCRREGVVMNADLVGAFNILKKVVRTITPSLPALSGGRGNWGKTVPEGLKTRFLVGFDETPQTSLPLG